MAAARLWIRARMYRALGKVGMYFLAASPCGMVGIVLWSGGKAAGESRAAGRGFRMVSLFGAGAGSRVDGYEVLEGE